MKAKRQRKSTNQFGKWKIPKDVIIHHKEAIIDGGKNENNGWQAFEKRHSEPRCKA